MAYPVQSLRLYKDEAATYLSCFCFNGIFAQKVLQSLVMNAGQPQPRRLYTRLRSNLSLLEIKPDTY